MPNVITLQIVYDDSDPMTDYYAPDRPLYKWKVTELTSNRITEPVLRRAQALLPSWLRDKTWTYRKGEKYSMSDHPYGQLRGEVLEGLVWSYAYGGRGYSKSGIQLLIDCEWKFSEEEYGAPMPQSFEEMQAFVQKLGEERTRKEAEAEAYRQSPEFRRRRIEGEIHTMEHLTAEIGANGFHMITPEERAAKIAELKKQLAEIPESPPTPTG